MATLSFPDMISRFSNIVLAICIGKCLAIGAKEAVTSNLNAVERIDVAVAGAGRLVAGPNTTVAVSAFDKYTFAVDQSGKGSAISR